jgi:hypothetical protein
MGVQRHEFFKPTRSTALSIRAKSTQKAQTKTQREAPGQRSFTFLLFFIGTVVNSLLRYCCQSPFSVLLLSSPFIFIPILV